MPKWTMDKLKPRTPAAPERIAVYHNIAIAGSWFWTAYAYRVWMSEHGVIPMCLRIQSGLGDARMAR